MKKYFYMTVIIVVGLFATDLRSNEIEYNVVCLEDQNTGFTWRNKGWVTAKFGTNKYLISKVKIGPNNDIMRCSTEKKSKGFTLGNMKSDSGCYNIREFGEEYYSIGSTWCVEHYEKSISSSDKFQLVSVTCSPTIFETFVFKPTGSFHRSYIHDFLSKDRSSNDTMHLSVGSCSKI